MPLSDYFSLEWYGPCCAAAVDMSTPSAVAGAQVNLSMGGVNTSVASSPLNALTNGRKLAAVNICGAFSPLATASIRLKLGAVGRVNTLTQEDVVGALQSMPIENGLSFLQVLRLGLAVWAGNATGLNSTPVFKSQDGAKNRITGTLSGENRTISGIDPT
jgi:hypothetical protein